MSLPAPARPEPAPKSESGAYETNRAERIATLRTRVYRPAPLDQYSRKQRFFIRFAALICYYLIYLIGLTVNWQMRGARDRHGDIPNDRPVIYVFWHNRILPATWYFRRMGIVVMTSQSYDGEI